MIYAITYKVKNRFKISVDFRYNRVTTFSWTFALSNTVLSVIIRFLANHLSNTKSILNAFNLNFQILKDICLKKKPSRYKKCSPALVFILNWTITHRNYTLFTTGFGVSKTVLKLIHLRKKRRFLLSLCITLVK